MFKYTALLAFVTLAISVSAAPLEIRADNKSAVANIKSSTVAVSNIKQKAAAYFITNEDTGNFIVAMDINTDNGNLVRL